MKKTIKAVSKDYYIVTEEGLMYTLEDILRGFTDKLIKITLETIE